MTLAPPEECEAPAQVSCSAAENNFGGDCVEAGAASEARARSRATSRSSARFSSTCCDATACRAARTTDTGTTAYGVTLASLLDVRQSDDEEQEEKEHCWHGSCDVAAIELTASSAAGGAGSAASTLRRGWPQDTQKRAR